MEQQDDRVLFLPTRKNSDEKTTRNLRKKQVVVTGPATWHSKFFKITMIGEILRNEIA